MQSYISEEGYEDFCNLEFIHEKAPGEKAVIKIKDEKQRVFCLEECVNQSFYEAGGQGKVYRVALSYDTKSPEDESHITLLNTHHLNDTPNSHSYSGASMTDYVDRTYYQYDEPQIIKDISHDDIKDVVLGEGLVKDMFRATRACVNFHQEMIARTGSYEMFTIPHIPRKRESGDASVNKQLDFDSHEKYVTHLIILLLDIGFGDNKYKDVVGGESLKMMLRTSDLQTQLQDSFDSGNPIIQKGQNLLHLLIPHILENELLYKFDLDIVERSHAKKLLLNLVGINPKYCGKELFNDWLLRPAT